jgi:hypothetical protein
VVYCGDGGGDLEGAMKVPSGGLVLARDGWSLHQGLLKVGPATDETARMCQFPGQGRTSLTGAKCFLLYADARKWIALR